MASVRFESLLKPKKQESDYSDLTPVSGHWQDRQKRLTFEAEERVIDDGFQAKVVNSFQQKLVETHKSMVEERRQKLVH